MKRKKKEKKKIKLKDENIVKTADSSIFFMTEIILYNLYFKTILRYKNLT